MSATDFSAQNSAISNRITKLRSDRKKKFAEAENDEINILKELDETIADYVPNGKFDEELFENIVKFGKAQSAKEGKVSFNYKYFFGYKKGEDGNSEIDENEAETIRYIYNRFLAGDSLQTICKGLENQKMLTPYGKEKWTSGTVQSILTNEKYKGDAVINKTYVVDCISKKVKVNDGDSPKYYVENNHPAIIDSATFGRVQEELAKRSGKKRVKFKGVKTEQGKYSSKYALTEMLICGECKTPYRRCTWTSRGEKRIVWRCVKRLDYGKRYCHSPTIEEGALQAAIVNAIQKVAAADGETMQTLKAHIDRAFTENITADNEEEMSLQIRISELDAEIKAMISSVSADTIDDFDEEKAQSLMSEKNELQNKLEELYGNKTRKEAVQSRLQDVYAIMDGLKNRQISRRKCNFEKWNRIQKRRRLFEISSLKLRSAWFENGTEKARKQRNENSKRLIKSAILGNADI